MTDSQTDPKAGAGGLEREITIHKTLVLAAEAQGKEVEVFTMSLGGETIELLPMRNWGQLDAYKWSVRGRLPGTPAGLEITFDHVRIAGETVGIKDPDGCAKLERLFNEWLALEKHTLELARKKAQAKAPVAVEAQPLAAPQPLHFQVEVDKEAQVHIKCLQGKELLAVIGLNPAGFNSLINQGLMHKPRSLKVGALHDWVELDGELFSFERGTNDARRLERALNERYLSDAALGSGKEVVVFPNAASSTGFDIQFPAKVGGVVEQRKRPLNEESIELLQDRDRCGLLPKGLVIKLSRPNLIFKQKTPDGGERYLDKDAANTVHLTGDDGQEKWIDLSQPVNYLRLSAVELTAVFNHPALNQHSKTAPLTPQPSGHESPVKAPRPQPEPRAQPPAAPPPAKAAFPGEGERPSSALATPEAAKPAVPAPPKPSEAGTGTAPSSASRPRPNLWLKNVLAQPPIRHDWFGCLVYTKIAEEFKNSREGAFGSGRCWAVALGEVEDIADPTFKGIFLTEKGGLGYVNRGRVARFYKGVVFLGQQDTTLEGIDVTLLGVGTDIAQRLVFIVSEHFRTRFGVSETSVVQELARLREDGAVVMSVNEVLESSEPLEVVWTAPAEQLNPSDPQALESRRPATTAPADDGPNPVAGM